MRNASTIIAAIALSGSITLGACGGGGTSESTIANDSAVSDDPFGATGAPGADMTDNGVTDGANGMADGNAMEAGSAPVDANSAEPMMNASNAQ